MYMLSDSALQWCIARGFRVDLNVTLVVAALKVEGVHSGLDQVGDIPNLTLNSGRGTQCVEGYPLHTQCVPSVKVAVRWGNPV